MKFIRLFLFFSLFFINFINAAEVKQSAEIPLEDINRKIIFDNQTTSAIAWGIKTYLTDRNYLTICHKIPRKSEVSLDFSNVQIYDTNIINRTFLIWFDGFPENSVEIDLGGFNENRMLGKIPKKIIIKRIGKEALSQIKDLEGQIKAFNTPVIELIYDLKAFYASKSKPEFEEPTIEPIEPSVGGACIVS